MLREIQSTIDQVWAYCRERDDAWNVPREAGRFLYAAAVAMRARRILEIGTSYGFSGLHLAAAARSNGGRLITIDASRKKVDVSRQHFARAGLTDVVEQHHGPAEQVIPSLSGPFDLVFVDAVKRSCLDYLRAFEPKLADRALIVTDNLTTHDESEFGDYLPALRGDGRCVSITLPVGNGFEYTVRRQA